MRFKQRRKFRSCKSNVRQMIQDKVQSEGAIVGRVGKEFTWVWRLTLTRGGEKVGVSERLRMDNDLSLLRWQKWHENLLEK